MNLLEKLDYLMDKYGLNKNTLSKKSGISYTTIDSLYKKGYRNTKLSTLIALAQFFNVGVDYLVMDDISDPMHGFNDVCSEEELSILDLYRNSDENNREAIKLILGYKPKPTPITEKSKQKSNEHADIMSSAVAAHDNKATLPKINEDGEVLGGAMKKRDGRQK